MRLKAKIDIPVIASAALAAALVSAGIFSISPSGEQSKLIYDGDLWCVSNFVGGSGTLKDGRQVKDPQLVGKEDWIVRDQVSAKSKEEAEQKAQQNGGGMFEPSNKDELRGWLGANDKKNFTSHFNTGATAPGPCLGTGSSTDQTGRWLNDAIREDCFGIVPESSSSVTDPDNLNTTASGACGDLRNPTAVSEKEIYDYLKKNNSPMAEATSGLMAAAKQYKVNPAFLVGISVQESSLGKAGRGANNKNPGNLRASRSFLASQGISIIRHDDSRYTVFKSWEDGIKALAFVLDRTYLSKGRTSLSKIAEIYLEGDKNHWIKGVNGAMESICK